MTSTVIASGRLSMSNSLMARAMRANFPPASTSSTASQGSHSSMRRILDKKAAARRRNFRSGASPAGDDLVRRSGGDEYLIGGLDADSELWEVMGFCDDAELEAVHHILYGPSPFSPVVKSIVGDNEPPAVSRRGRAGVMRRIESRFRFLGADAVSTLKGHRPSYREVLVHMRQKLHVQCPSDLGTSELEAEIFLHLLNNYAGYVQSTGGDENKNVAAAVVDGDGMAGGRPLKRGWKWMERVTAPLKFGRSDVVSLLGKFGGAVTISAVKKVLLQDIGTQLVVRRLNYQSALKTLYDEGVASLRSRAAVQAAHRGLTAVAVRYSTVRSALSMLGPLMWAWLGADLVLKSVGTDYSRIIKTVFALAQVRLLRTYGLAKLSSGIARQYWSSSKQ